MEWQKVFETLGTVAIGSGALVYILRKLFDQMLSRDMEKFKSDLKASAFEQETRFARLHEDRARVIDQLYGLLVEAHQGLVDYVYPLQVAGEQGRFEKQKQTAEKLNRYFAYFQSKDIYLDPLLCEDIARLNAELKRAFSSFYDENPPPNEWVKSWKKVEEDIPPIKTKIANTFRAIIGVGSS